MAKHHHRRARRSWSRTLLLVIFLLAAVLGVYSCVFRKPQVDVPAADPQQDLSDSSSGAVSSQQDPVPVNQRKDDFYNILISGVDDGNGGSDTNILVAFDAKNGCAHCVSIPRDSGVYINGKARKVNFAYNTGGTELLAQTVSDTLGIPVDFTIEVRLNGFIKLVDAIGGVDFDVPLNMNYDDPLQGLSIHLKRGMQHLDGKRAMGVVRFRHNNDGSGYGSEDLGRIGTQQAFLKAVAKQTLTLSNVDKVGEFAKIFQEYVTTDLKVENLAWLAKEAISMGIDNISFSTLPGEWSGKRSLYLLDGDAVLELVNAQLNPYTTDRIMDDLNLVS